MNRIKPKMSLSEVKKKSPHISPYLSSIVLNGMGAKLNLKSQQLGGGSLGTEGSWETAEKVYSKGYFLVFGREDFRQMILLFWHAETRLYLPCGNGGIPEIYDWEHHSEDDAPRLMQAYFPREPEATIEAEFRGRFLPFQNEDGTRVVFLVWQPELKLYGSFGRPLRPFIFERVGTDWRILNVTGKQRGR
jgi:hypothetical protein